MPIPIWAYTDTIDAARAAAGVISPKPQKRVRGVLSEAMGRIVRDNPSVCVTGEVGKVESHEVVEACEGAPPLS